MAAGLEKHLRDSVHQLRWRVVGNELSAKLGGNEPSGCGMYREVIEHRFAVRGSAAPGNRQSHHALGTWIMRARLEDKGGFPVRLLEGPPSEASSRFADVLLCVAPVHPHGV